MFSLQVCDKAQIKQTETNHKLKQNKVNTRMNGKKAYLNRKCKQIIVKNFSVHFGLF
jgi:hypothetical protein